MKKLIALMLIVSFTGAVIAQQAAPQTAPAKPATSASNSTPTAGKDAKEKKKHHHHHRHHKPAEKK